MKVALSWLNDYVSIQMDTARLADALTLSGIEVETIEDRYAYLKHVKVGRVLEIEPHPHASHLKRCLVDVGDRKLSIVCGAPNVHIGEAYPVAEVGTVLPSGVTIAASTIRGVPSEGMLCSEAELGLGEDASCLMVLPVTAKTGESLKSFGNWADPVFELGLTPNRADCLGMIGVAREIAALQKTGWKRPDVCIPDTTGRIEEITSVTIQAPDACRRYAASVIMDITVGPSPFWLQDRLLAIGQRPINNVVDITNYVMMETGQPLHAFDYDRLAQNRIVVRTALDQETFVTLDHRERVLDSDVLMICDGEKPVAIAGVMGGMNSEIEPSTRRVLLESAWFDATSIRKTSRRLGLKTEASHRFERGVDPEGIVPTLMRATELIATVCGGKMVGGIIDVYPKPHVPVQITLSAADTRNFLGCDIPDSAMPEILERLEFRCEPVASESWRVTVPSHRVDVSRPVDLMEEIARMHGFNTIPVTLPDIHIPPAALPFSQKLREMLRDRMVGLGFLEAIHYSFISAKSCDQLMIPEDDERRHTVAVRNPLTEDQAVMRTSLLPGLLAAMQRNLFQQQRHLRLFEIGNVFFDQPSEKLPEEREMLAALWTGSRYGGPRWYSSESDCDFYDMKGIVEALMESMGWKPTFERGDRSRFPYLRHGASAQIRIGQTVVGCIGEIHPKVLDAFDLNQTGYIFELDVQALRHIEPAQAKAVPLPKFPSISRDTTLIVDKHQAAMEMVDAVYAMQEPLIEDVSIFAVYEGAPLPEGKKSVSLRIVYRSDRSTLADETVTRLHQDVCERLMPQFAASLPADR
ncbi:MAG: phenylalanine--tRNA ligase subunit beta [Thermodesulfobacteriota bacterium]